MPKNTAAVTDNDAERDELSGVQWETEKAGLGEAWDFERFGPLVGNYIGSTSMTLPDTNHPGEMRDQAVYQFAPHDDPEAVVFVWGCYSLDQVFQRIDPLTGEIGLPLGTLCRILALGKTSIKGGKQQLNQYRVQTARQTA